MSRVTIQTICFCHPQFRDHINVDASNGVNIGLSNGVNISFVRALLSSATSKIAQVMKKKNFSIAIAAMPTQLKGNEIAPDRISHSDSIGS